MKLYFWHFSGYEGYGFDDYDFEGDGPAEYPWNARWKNDVEVERHEIIKGRH